MGLESVVIHIISLGFHKKLADTLEQKYRISEMPLHLLIIVKLWVRLRSLCLNAVNDVQQSLFTVKRTDWVQSVFAVEIGFFAADHAPAEFSSAQAFLVRELYRDIGYFVLPLTFRHNFDLQVAQLVLKILNKLLVLLSFFLRFSLFLKFYLLLKCLLTLVVDTHAVNHVLA